MSDKEKDNPVKVLSFSGPRKDKDYDYYTDEEYIEEQRCYILELLDDNQSLFEEIVRLKNKLGEEVTVTEVDESK